MGKLLLFCLFSFFALNLASTKNAKSHESVGEYFDSSTITAKVKAVLAGDANIRSIGINVDTYKNIVQLSGFVDNKIQKERAEKLAKNVKGVNRVINSLNIKEQF